MPCRLAKALVEGGLKVLEITPRGPGGVGDSPYHFSQGRRWA